MIYTWQCVNCGRKAEITRRADDWESTPNADEAEECTTDEHLWQRDYTDMNVSIPMSSRGGQS